ncbi:MAG: threonine synthase [Coriobacteriia bacterium]|nr:threonine synthase [Coriobacteriia bacterium]
MSTMDYTNTYTDTRGHTTEPLTFSQAIIKGMAQGGGLFVPLVLPQLSLDEIVGLGSLDYGAQAAFIYQRFGVDLPAEQVEALMAEAYADNFDAAEIAPITQVTPDTWVLELWHGPTSAFKDMALQCLPPFFSAAIEDKKGTDPQTPPSLRAEPPEAAQRDRRGRFPSVLNRTHLSGTAPATRNYLILVATSGDTGKAALEGFKDRAHTRIIVFYPQDGVSDIQYRQMATQQGDNVAVIGVLGNFDDCQTAVKAAFNDPAFNQALASEHNIQLSSANSINWGRLLPQVVYYVSAYAQLVHRGALAPGSELDICVPTGNFGNILAAFYAGQIGVPIGRLFCASNENRVLTDFINTGVYDITNRPFRLTPSPSMDILVSSNLERQLFELNGRDPQRIRQWMGDLAATRRFQVDRDTFAALRASFSADWVSSDECLMTIKTVFDAHGYLLDPHTAVAWKVAERLRGENPVLVVATAHWAKFGADVYRALNGLPAGSALPAEAAALGDVALNHLIASTALVSGGRYCFDTSTLTIPEVSGGRYCFDTSTLAIPAPLAELNDLPIRFTQTCEGTAQAVQQAVLSTLPSIS